MTLLLAWCAEHGGVDDTSVVIIGGLFGLAFLGLMIGREEGR